MELVCSIRAEPLPMQILALANNAGKANQVCDCQLETSHQYSSKPHHIHDFLFAHTDMSWHCRMLKWPMLQWQTTGFHTWTVWLTWRSLYYSRWMFASSHCWHWYTTMTWAGVLTECFSGIPYLLQASKPTTTFPLCCWRLLQLCLMPLSNQRYVAITQWCVQSNWPLVVMFAVCGHSLVLQDLFEGSDE